MCTLGNEWSTVDRQLPVPLALSPLCGGNSCTCRASLSPNPLSYLMLYYAIIPNWPHLCNAIVQFSCLYVPVLCLCLASLTIYYYFALSLTHMYTHTWWMVASGNSTSTSGEQCSPLKCKVITSSSPSASPYTPPPPPPPPPNSQAQGGEILDTK